MAGYGYLESDWRREALRTNFWLTPTLLILCALVLFGITFNIDHAVYAGRLELPAWILSGTADAARIILATIAGAIITVVGVVFSITIVALTMASTQFGPRMLRNFLRDLGTQLTLGAFVATFCYAVITLVSVGGGPQGAFVPHLSVTTALVLTLVDVGVLIYFLNHVASMIQLPVVIAGVATTLADEIAAQDTSGDRDSGPQRGPSYEDLMVRLESAGAEIRTPHSGYLQVLRHESLLKMAAANDAVLYLLYRPGHFMVTGQAMAKVWPPGAAANIERNLGRGQVTGPYRTLAQDISFGFDQLVEIALRALSPAVNDTFTALTCIDWLGECLCRISTSWRPQRVRRDAGGHIRVIALEPDFDRLVGRSFEKIRQASEGMPAVMIRQLDALAKVIDQTPDPHRRATLRAEADRIQRANLRSVPELSDQQDVTRRYAAVLWLLGDELPSA